ncbi:CubicO group peptidase, beta-lactamase class C family [Allosphingosinicella indica]|uniref:CubicO group peptidase, beta-lactamase class C family n=2 Tax=Allosphingosinicella indica TaxID=941907 RepID=A0A1X7H015_9SPHN|nr:CubicO group peptidase, beta-lactamase class C family [Allosphingosinicella indica]
MAETKVPAVSIAFIEDGRVKWARAYGQAAAGRRVTTRTRFQAASLSKAVAAAGALRMAERGVIDLDADVAPRLRGWRLPVADPGKGESVTLRRLLSHTAGLTLGGYPGYAAGEPVPTIVESLSGAVPSNTPAVRAFAPPGAKLAYSGGGYSVAQLAMSEAARRDFALLMRDRVLKPAGMAHSAFARFSDRETAVGHDETGAQIWGGSHRYSELAAAGLWTTPSDYGRFLIAIQKSWAGEQGALLSRSSAQAMATPVLGDYGLGVIALDRGGRRIITHGGSNAGFQCRFTALLDGSRQGLVVMTNGDNGGALAAAIQRTVAGAYGWDDTSAPPTPRAPDS